jgi:hypothetical protein
VRHLTSQELSAHLDRALTGRAGEEAERHLGTCADCRESLAALAAQDAALRPALTHEPGEAYFESFAERVGERIRAAGPTEARTRGQGFEFGRVFRSPRALTWVGAAAVVVVGAGLALMSGREVRPPDLRDRDLAERSQQVAPDAARPLETVPPAGTMTGGAAPPLATAGRERDDAAKLKDTAPGSQEEMVSGGAPVGDEQHVEVGRTNRPRWPENAKTRAPQDRLTLASPPPVTRQASPGRAVEMQRNAAGEDVPVPRPAASPSAPSAGAADMAQRTEGTEQSRKKLAAEPLKRGSTWGTVKSLYSGVTKSESGSSRDSFARPPETNSLEVTAPRRVDVPSYSSKQTILATGEARLCGEVRDAAGRPVVGAQVSVADVGRTTTTDARGAFCVSAPVGKHPLSVMAVGFTESRQTVGVGTDKAAVRVTLEAVSVMGDTRARASEPQSGMQFMNPAEPRDAYAALPDTLRAMVRAAQQLETRATSRRSAGLFDAAAAGWERTLRRLAGGPLELETRWHLAETRYRAWEAGRNDRRAAAAVEALTAYALRAQVGAERDRAIRWLDQVRH